MSSLNANDSYNLKPFGLLSDLHQHQHFDTLHIVDTRTTLARHGSLL